MTQTGYKIDLIPSDFSRLPIFHSLFFILSNFKSPNGIQEKSETDTDAKSHKLILSICSIHRY